jgi:hypothetical protein
MIKRIKFDFTAEEKRERAREKVREKEIKQIIENEVAESKADEAIIATEPKKLVFSNDIENPIILMKSKRHYTKKKYELEIPKQRKLLTRSSEPVGDLRLTDGAFESPTPSGRRRLNNIVFSNKYSRKSNVHLRIPEELVERYELFRKVVYSCRKPNQEFFHFQKRYRNQLMVIASKEIKESWQLLPITSKMASYLYHIQPNETNLETIFTPEVMENFLEELVPVKRNRSKLIDINTEEGLLRLRKEHLVELMVEFSGYKLTDSDANEIIERLYISRSKTIPIRPRIHKKLQMAIFEKINSSVST